MIINETSITTRAISIDPLDRWTRGQFKPRFLIDTKGRALEVIDLREVERRLKARETNDEAR